MTSKQVQRFHEEASERLYELSRLALPGAKLTLLVRRPNAQDGSQDMVVTDDDIGEVIRALQIRLATNQPAPDPCSCGWALHQPRDGKCQRCGTPDPRLAHAPTETAPPSAVAWAQGYLQSTNDGYSGRTSPNPYRPGWQGSDGESEGEPDARGGCCVDCGGKSHTGACVYMRPAPLAREALASARLDVETHCLPDAEGPRGAREATAGWPVEEPGVLQRLRAEPTCLMAHLAPGYKTFIEP